jgi:molybdopterin/thiamine biosynthesis adenylyltransferase
MKIGQDMVEQLLLDEKAEYKTVMLGFTGRRGASFAGLRLIEEPPKRFGSGSALSKGFRGRPPAHILLMRYRGFPVVGARVFRFDGPWVHGRDHNPYERTLATKSVIVLGVGSVGSSVAELLAKSGVGTLILVDHDLLAPENLGRHALGAQSVGDSKARALAKSLSARFPHLTFEHITQSWEGFADAMPDRLRGADLVISTMGSWRAESRLNALANQTEFPPVLYGWTEPHAVAGHAVVFFHGQRCLRCLTDALGLLHIPVSAWPKEGTMLPVPTCGGQFQPYGAVELIHIHGLVAGLALDVLVRQIAGTTHRVWIGQRKFLERIGGRWHQAWIERHGNPGEGGMLIEAEFYPNPTCPECGSTQ